MSAMTGMSQAIRLQIEKHGPNLQALPDEILRDYVLIVGAFYTDLRAEAVLRRRLPVTRGRFLNEP